MSVGSLVVISAPSGVGKTTICRLLQAAHPDWHFSVSATTRPRRSNEVNGSDYIFISDEEFDAYLADGLFVEWEEVHGHRYGTLRTSLQKAQEAGHPLLLDVDVRGGVNIKREYPNDTVAIFVVPPDEESHLQRLRQRGTENEASIQKRLSRMAEEMGYKDSYDYVVVNDDLERTVKEIETIIMEKI